MKLSLGTAQFGFNYGICNENGIVKFQEVKKIIKFCELKKINSIDTAQGYGKSHKVLGSINLKKFQITTKISKIVEKQNQDFEKTIISQINRNFKDLGVKNVYSLLIHNTNSLKGKLGSNFYKTLQKLKKEKKFIKLGVSVYTKKELNFVLKNFNIDIVNLPISIANQEFCKNDYLLKLKKKKYRNSRQINFFTRVTFI